MRALTAAVMLAAGAAGALPALAKTTGPLVATAGSPVHVATVARPLKDATGASLGPASDRTVRLSGCHATRLTSTPSGEGTIAVTMDAPGTSWASATRTSVVVDVTVDSGTPQQIVLYDGSAPFTYTGFTGPLATGPHCVTISVRPDLSADTAPPTVDVRDVRLGVVNRTDPAYPLVSHAPVLYGRSLSSVGDTPLLTYGEQTPVVGGGADLSYTVIWTHEDVGDGAVPAYEWGLWGRMTDIETVLTERLHPDGSVASASYLSCGCENAPLYPDELPETGPTGETDQPFRGQWSGTHPVLRDATGNNDMSDAGTSTFRFQQAPVAGPAPGLSRETAMDTHPWTYRISNEELSRKLAAEHSTSARDILPGDYPQYLIVDLDTTPHGTQSVAVEVQLSGSSIWWSSDYRQAFGDVPTTFPFYTGGHARTVIKLPPDWHAHRVSALRLRLNVAAGSPATAASITVHSLHLIEVTPGYQVRERQPAHIAPPVTATGLWPVAP